MAVEPALADPVQQAINAEGTLFLDAASVDAARQAVAKHETGVVVAGVHLGFEAIAGLLEALMHAGSAATLVLLGEMPGDWPALSAFGCRVRVLRDVPNPDILVQAVLDCLETHRLRRTEQTLQLQLEQARSRVNELSEYLNEQSLFSTTAILRMHHAVAGLSSLNTAQEVCNLLVTAVAGISRSRRVTLLLPDTSRTNLRVVAATGTLPSDVENLRIPLGATVSGEVFVSGQTLVVPPSGRLPARWDQRVDAELLTATPCVCMALSDPDHAVAVLNISEPASPDVYNEQVLTAVQAVGEAGAIAIVNQIRAQERNDARDKIMLALAKLAESRDPETGKHLERVQNYCRLLAEALAETSEYCEVITPEFIRTLVRSSPLHDIGKVGIPDSILLKPGKLTAEEFEAMKRHPIIGGDTIRSLIAPGGGDDFLHMAMEIAYYHHEKYAGEGYPYHLAGEQIPLPARIMALADVYDALTSARVYKAQMPHAEAREIILKGSGTHFDPVIVHAFQQREREFEKLASDLADTN